MKIKRIKSAFLHKNHLAVVLLCLMIVMTILPLSVYAQTDDKSKVVRVGWFDSSDNMMDSSGRRSGYCYEYERKIAAYTNWKYEYVEGSWVELLQKLENGEIDMLGGVSFTEERLDKILFSSYAMGTQDYYLYPESVKLKMSDKAERLINTAFLSKLSVLKFAPNGCRKNI